MSAESVRQLIVDEARRQGVNPSVALAVARQESNFNQSAVSPKGAIGVMQLMPGTARDLGVNPYDVAQNVRGGVSYLRTQYDRFGSWSAALQAYNGGPEHVARGDVSADARLYAAQVQGRFNDFAAYDSSAGSPDAGGPSDFLSYVLGGGSDAGADGAAAELPAWAGPAAAIGGAALLFLVFG